MTNEQAIKRLKHLTFEPTIDELDEEALNMAIEALSAQPEQSELECDKCVFKPFKQFQPERKKGEWIYDAEAYPLGNPYGHYDCDQCGESVPDKTNFCPNCGADMKGENNET